MTGKLMLSEPSQLIELYFAEGELAHARAVNALNDEEKHLAKMHCLLPLRGAKELSNSSQAGKHHSARYSVNSTRCSWKVRHCKITKQH